MSNPESRIAEALDRLSKYVLILAKIHYNDTHTNGLAVFTEEEKKILREETKNE